MKEQSEIEETELMNSWELIENLQSEIDETKDYESGSVVTLEELKTEVNATCSDFSKEILNTNNRKNELLKSLGKLTHQYLKN